MRQWDAHGEAANPIAYRWNTHFFGPLGAPTRGYLTDIFDTPPASLDVTTTDFTFWAHHVRLDYEGQPFTTFTHVGVEGGNAMFRWHDFRLKRVAVTSMDFKVDGPRAEVRMYALDYQDAPLVATSRLNSSYLTQVTLLRDGAE